MSRRVARQENFQEAFPENVPSLQLIMKKKTLKNILDAASRVPKK